MSISVRPDPDHPLGGHALLTVRGSVAAGPVMVAVTDLFEDRHLGTKGWQSAPVTLGPYAAIDEGGAVVVPIGPEIVDHIEEFQTLRIAVGGIAAELAWPETIRTSPSRAGRGGLGVLSANEEAKRTTTTGEDETKEGGGMPPPVYPPNGPRDEKSRLVPILVGLALLAAIGGGAFWYLSQEEDAVAVVQPEPLTTPGPLPTPAPITTPAPAPVAGCDTDSLTAARALPPAEGFAQVRACGTEGDPELRFQVIEAAADAGLAEAVAMIGRWYDPAEAEAVGSGFTSRDTAQAARHYHEAANAGYAPANELLQAACAGLDPTLDPTHEIARDLYCN